MKFYKILQKNVQLEEGLLLSQFKIPVVMNEHIKVLSCNMRHFTKPKFQKTILLIKNPLSQSCKELSI